jgi:hypothetical protein
MPARFKQMSREQFDELLQRLKLTDKVNAVRAYYRDLFTRLQRDASSRAPREIAHGESS